MVKTINNKVFESNEKGLQESLLNEVFENYYKDLKNDLIKIRDKKPSKQIVERSDRELLEEILEMLRGLNRVDNNSNQTDKFIKPMRLGDFLTTGGLSGINVNELPFVNVTEKKENDKKPSP